MNKYKLSGASGLKNNSHIEESFDAYLPSTNPKIGEEDQKKLLIEGSDLKNVEKDFFKLNIGDEVIGVKDRENKAPQNNDFDHPNGAFSINEKVDEYEQYKTIMNNKKNEEKRINNGLISLLGALNDNGNLFNFNNVKDLDVGAIKKIVYEYDKLIKENIIISSNDVNNIWNNKTNELISNYANIYSIINGLSKTKAVSINKNGTQYKKLIDFDGIRISEFQIFNGGITGFLKLLKEKSISIVDVTVNTLDVINNIITSDLYNAFNNIMDVNFIMEYNDVLEKSHKTFANDYKNIILEKDLPPYKYFKYFVEKRFVFCDLHKLLIVLNYEEINHVIKVDNLIRSFLKMDKNVFAIDYRIIVDILYLLKVCDNGDTVLKYINKLYYLLEYKNVTSIVKQYNKCFKKNQK